VFSSKDSYFKNAKKKNQSSQGVIVTPLPESDYSGFGELITVFGLVVGLVGLLTTASL